MSVTDIASDLKQSLALNATIVSDTTTVGGAIIDDADFEMGIMFTLAVTAFTDGSYTLVIEESSDAGMAGATAVTGDQLIGTLPVAIALSADGAALGKVGVISNLRYLRASVVSTGTTSGATVEVMATQKGEVCPV